MSFRKTILISMISLTVICGVAVLVSSIFLFSSEINNALRDKNNIAENVLRHEIERLKIKSHIAVLGMADTPPLRSALINNDREQIINIANALKNMAQIDYCAIADSTGRVLIRTHDPDNYGDSIADLPQVKSAMAGKTEVHIIQGAAVRLGISAGTPIYDDDMNIIGIVSMGFRFDNQDFVNDLKELTGCEITFFLNDTSVASTLVYEDGTFISDTKAFEHISRQVLAGETYIGRLERFGRNMLAKYIPLYGEDSEIVGMVFIGNYTEEETRKIFVFVINGALITLAVILACLMIAGIISGAIENRLSGMMNALRKASKAKSDFLANMSHEMRTPLNAVIGMTLIGKRGDDIEGKIDALNKIEDASSHLLGLVDDILDMAKIEADTMELSPVTYDFNKMLRQVLAVIKFRADEKNQILTVNTDVNLPRYVVGDGQRLAQIIINLLSNAVKFTGESGAISLDASLIGEDENGRIELKIEVADNGIGISLEQQAKIFELFEQAESGTSREYSGAGLGLSIVKRIVDIMGGRIRVESELGKGAKFVVTVFAERGYKDGDDQNNSDNSAKVNTSGAMFAGKRMLIAEDIEINREILLTLLEDTGLIVDCAENGKEALDMIIANPDHYDIVFMDLQMPQMDGLEAARHIRALPAGRRGRLPIIAMTANVFKEDIEDCLLAGMDDHLGKPLDIDKVLDILNRYLNK